MSGCTWRPCCCWSWARSRSSWRCAGWLTAPAEQHDHVNDDAIEGIRAQLQGRLDRYRRRLDVLQGAEGGEVPMSPQYEAALRVRRAVLNAQREELLHRRDVGRLPDEGLRRLEAELDHEEGRLPTRR